MLGLDVTIDTKSGFCFGVEYAIEIAEEILEQDGELYCLGDIVHNDMEVKRLEDMGLKIIDHEELTKSFLVFFCHFLIKLKTNNYIVY